MLIFVFLAFGELFLILLWTLMCLPALLTVTNNSFNYGTRGDTLMLVGFPGARLSQPGCLPLLVGCSSIFVECVSPRAFIRSAGVTGTRHHAWLAGGLVSSSSSSSSCFACLPKSFSTCPFSRPLEAAVRAAFTGGTEPASELP